MVTLCHIDAIGAVDLVVAFFGKVALGVDFECADIAEAAIWIAGKM